MKKWNIIKFLPRVLRGTVTAAAPLGMPPHAPAMVPTPRRRVTTVVGSVLVTMAGFGLLGLMFLMLDCIFGSRTSTVPHAVLLINGTLSVLSKVGLLVLGVLLIRRHPQAGGAAAAGLSLSLIDSMFFLVAVVPPMRASMHPALSVAFTFGAWIPAVMSSLLYIGVFVYLGQPASRQEFGRANA